MNDEKEEKSEKTKTAFSAVGLAIKAIREKEGEKRGCRGTVPCPTCGKPLHYSIAACNGHIHARCEGGDVMFMM